MYSYAHGAHLNLDDLTPYIKPMHLTFGKIKILKELMGFQEPGEGEDYS
jgi:hypothetical protein